MRGVPNWKGSGAISGKSSSQDEVFSAPLNRAARAQAIKNTWTYSLAAHTQSPSPWERESTDWRLCLLRVSLRSVVADLHSHFRSLARFSIQLLDIEHNFRVPVAQNHVRRLIEMYKFLVRRLQSRRRNKSRTPH